MEFLTSFSVSSTGGFLVLGFFIGMLHAFETDHLAAISTMITGNRRQLILRGALWGVGHTTTLMILSMAVVLFSFALTEARAAALEFAVGIMLVILGADVLRRLRKSQVHVHVHKHGDEGVHFHLHSHPGAGAGHPHDAHDHSHDRRLPLRALLIGLVHGAAGSAGLMVLAAAAAGSAWLTLGYVAVFGLGSILGMAGVSALISLPIAWVPRNIRGLNTGAKLAIALVAISFGLRIMYETGPIAAALFQGPS